MRPYPVMKPSPGGRCCSMPKSSQRWVTNLSSSSKLPSSRSSAMRSRAGEFAGLALAIAAFGAAALLRLPRCGGAVRSISLRGSVLYGVFLDGKAIFGAWARWDSTLGRLAEKEIPSCRPGGLRPDRWLRGIAWRQDFAENTHCQRGRDETRVPSSRRRRGRIRPRWPTLKMGMAIRAIGLTPTRRMTTETVKTTDHDDTRGAKPEISSRNEARSRCVHVWPDGSPTSDSAKNHLFHDRA